MRTNTNNNGGFDPFGYSTGNWYHSVVTWDASDTQLRVYVNGIERGNTNLNGATLYTIPPVAEPTIGNTSTVDRGYDGLLQEARVSSIARDADWILTEYNNQDDPSSFYSVGPEDCSGALAITLLDFDAFYNQETQGVDLVWQASYDELEDEGFEIQRSWDGMEFQTLSFVPVKGLLNEIINYTYNDTEATNFNQSQAFYRLRIIEAGGKISFSNIKRVVLPIEKVRVNIYPNPTLDRLVNVRIIGTSILPSLDIINSVGRTVSNGQLESFSQVINLTGLAKGIYLLRFYSDELVMHKRLIVF